jgi:Fe-S cluster assembly protein SufD
VSVALATTTPIVDWEALLSPLGGDQTALQQFVSLGLPNRRQEDWKYTQFGMLEKGAWSIAKPAGTAAPKLGITGAWHLIVDNGVLDLEASTLPDQDGIEVKIVDAKGVAVNAMQAMNLAGCKLAIEVTVARNVVAKKPLQLVCLNNLEAEELAISRCSFNLGVSSELKVIEYQLGEGAGFANQVIDVDVGANAKFVHGRIQQLADPTSMYSAVNVSIARDGRYFADSFDLGGRTVRNDIRAELNEPGASVELDGLYAPTGRQHQDTHSWIVHNAPDCISRQLYKGVMDQRGRAVFNGIVRVERDAQRTDSEMQNRNILLSRHAEVDTKPELVIYADDVKCAHGATVGELDGTALFYLRSRGIPEDDARSLLVYAFAAELIEKIEHGEMRDYLANAFADRLPGNDIVKAEALAWTDNVDDPLEGDSE